MNEKITTLVNQAFDSLTTSLEAGKSGQLLTYLSFLSRFPQYSFTNCLLIALQRPSSSQVMGFHGWRKVGRWVKKGERGISIICPVVYRRKDQQPLVEEQEETILRFTGGVVFDIDQTDGEPVPEFASVKGDPSCFLMRLHGFARDQGILVEHKDNLGGAKGLACKGTIQILNGLPAPEEFSVTCHEIAHTLLHQSERRQETTKTIRETEAEAVSFVCCCAIGLDPGTASSDYIHLYNGDAEVLRESLDHIQKASKMILQDIL